MFKCRSHGIFSRASSSAHGGYHCNLNWTITSPLVRSGSQQPGSETGARSCRPLLRPYTTSHWRSPSMTTTNSTPQLLRLHPSHSRQFSSSLLVKEEVAAIPNDAQSFSAPTLPPPTTTTTTASKSSRLSRAKHDFEKTSNPDRASRVYKRLFNNDTSAASESHPSRLHSSKRIAPPHRSHLSGAKHHLSAKQEASTSPYFSSRTWPMDPTVSLDANGLPTTNESISPSIQILCTALEEARINRVHAAPPVFMAATYNQAENAMHLFEQYYKNTPEGRPGTVGFDTETTTDFIRSKHRGVSLVQIATKDICLFFQVYRITRMNSDKSMFPPRLRAFLEDPEQLMAGVGVEGDARDLLTSYGVQCTGLVNLEKMSKARNCPERSLASLDAKFGTPGREVVKTKAILKWNWDLERYKPAWVWYAAKDAFAGQVIFENMMKGQVREGYKSYLDLHPMTEEEEARDAFKYLSLGIGRGTKTTVPAVTRLLVKIYPRFHKAYIESERHSKAQACIAKMMENGLLVRPCDSKPESLSETDVVHLFGHSLARSLPSKAGINVLSPLFNNQRVILGESQSSDVLDPGNDITEDKDNVDLKDLKLFLDMGGVWNRPKKTGSLVSAHASIIRNATNMANLVEPSAVEQGPEDVYETTKLFLQRMKYRGVLEQTPGDLWQIVPLIEDQVTREYEKEIQLKRDEKAEKMNRVDSGNIEGEEVVMATQESAVETTTTTTSQESTGAVQQEASTESLGGVTDSVSASHSSSSSSSSEGKDSNSTASDSDSNIYSSPDSTESSSQDPSKGEEGSDVKSA